MSAKRLRLFPPESHALQAVRLAVVTQGCLGDLYGLLQLNKTWNRSICSGSSQWWVAVAWHPERACIDALPGLLRAPERALLPKITLQLQALARHCTVRQWRVLCESGFPRLRDLTLCSSRPTLGQRPGAMVESLDLLPLVCYCGPLAACPVSPTLRCITLTLPLPGRFTPFEVLAKCPQLRELHDLPLAAGQAYLLAHPTLQTLTACTARLAQQPATLGLGGLPHLQRLHLSGNILACHFPRSLKHLAIQTLPPQLPPQLQSLVVALAPECASLAGLAHLRTLRLLGLGGKLSVKNMPQLAVLECNCVHIELQATAELTTLLLPQAQTVAVTGSLAGVRTLDCPVALDCRATTAVTLYGRASAETYSAVQQLTHMSCGRSWLQLAAPQVTLDGTGCVQRSLAVQGAPLAALTVEHFRFLRSMLAEPGALRHLRQLRLVSCWALDLSSLNVDFLSACPHLRVLSVQGGMRAVQQNIRVQLPELRTLHLDWDTSSIHLRTLLLQCPRLQSLVLRAETRAYLHLPLRWHLPASLTHLTLRYDLSWGELNHLMGQLPALAHLTWRGGKQHRVKLRFPRLQRLEYEISSPTVELDLRLCPQLRSVHLRSATASTLLRSLLLPPTASTVCLDRKCRILKGVPTHARRFALPTGRF